MALCVDFYSGIRVKLRPEEVEEMGRKNSNLEVDNKLDLLKTLSFYN